MNLPPLEESLRQSIIDHNFELLYYLSMQPGNSIELGLALFTGVVVLTFAISRILILGKAGTGSLLLTLFAVIISSFFMIQVASFTTIWLLPKFELSQLENVIVPCATLFAFLFMVVPFTRFLLKSSYFISMTSWLIGAAIALGAVFLLSYTYDEPREGATPVDTLEAIRDKTQNEELFPVLDSE